MIKTELKSKRVECISRKVDVEQLHVVNKGSRVIAGLLSINGGSYGDRPPDD